MAKDSLTGIHLVNCRAFDVLWLREPQLTPSRFANVCRLTTQKKDGLLGTTLVLEKKNFPSMLEEQRQAAALST